ncbi:PucR family transcriptional regulator [Clostridium algidicarnis]|uniref:PucR family transcriptional regulator n=1 Tax=Clostridium algidicarnis TaxID=37659 RepID=UPI001623E647|nr:PucR family transcriptional regulator ligand-binding domain-containing protein [Clostridium algidicarnis]MBB6631445.1 PucR family transcriptional regulator ligand-binding domain-containing protein [Clostridium algidicarnis]MBU3192474.1 PucR family transcriptional regulator ligand-binding domain-containing protein [Clostridium algidicarnis]
MGLEIREILRSDYFKDFKVLAGHNGLNKQIQGIAILDAPDGYKWTKGRELVISSGYIFKAYPNLFEKYMNDEKFRDISGMAIKIDRYLKEIDKNVLDKFNEYNIPLISVPNEPSWMDIINALNVLVMNTTMKQFKIDSINARTISDVSYQNRKINKILYKIEKEMNFPAMLYDILNDKEYCSSHKFEEISAELELSDFWEPSFDYTTEIICDNLDITRYRFIDKKYKDPFSWIKIPVIIDEKVKAYFIVLEAEGLIDYFDQFKLRIGFLLIQSLYEQILVSQNLRDAGFKNFISDIINKKLVDKDNILERGRELDLDMHIKYITVVAKEKQCKNFIETEAIERNFQMIFGKIQARISFVSESSYLILIPIDKNISTEDNVKNTKKLIDKFKNLVKTDRLNINLNFGISDIPTLLMDTYKSYKRALKALEMGNMLYRDFYYITYSELGPLVWMDIKHDEINIMENGIKNLLVKDKDRELVKTLDTYLGSNMNYSLTAKKLFVHINTVRKRIECINELIDIDLEDPISRLKLEILLKLR